MRDEASCQASYSPKTKTNAVRPKARLAILKSPTFTIPAPLLVVVAGLVELSSAAEPVGLTLPVRDDLLDIPLLDTDVVKDELELGVSVALADPATPVSVDELPLSTEEVLLPGGGVACEGSVRAPTPHAMESPLGWVALGAGVVLPEASAMAKRVVHTGSAPALVNW